MQVVAGRVIRRANASDEIAARLNPELPAKADRWAWIDSKLPAVSRTYFRYDRFPRLSAALMSRRDDAARSAICSDTGLGYRAKERYVTGHAESVR